MAGFVLILELGVGGHFAKLHHPKRFLFGFSSSHFICLCQAKVTHRNSASYVTWKLLISFCCFVKVASSDPNFFFHISSSWVIIRMHIEIQLASSDLYRLVSTISGCKSVLSGH